MKNFSYFRVALSGLLALCHIAATAETVPLPALAADLKQTSVSGISSGGFMTSQLATAFSSEFIGAGVIAAGPFYCAGTYGYLSGITNATGVCMSPLTAAVGASGQISYKNAQSFAKAGKIDSVDNLAKQRVYIFSGSSDAVVKRIVVDQVEAYYQLAGVPKQNIRYFKNNAGHSIVTDQEGDVPCAETRGPYINNCGFIQSHELLSHIYGPLNKPAEKGKGSGKILKINQKEFIKGKRTSMSDDAYVYVPKACNFGGCRVHVAFHGCLQGAREINDKFYTGTLYNEIADTNKIIVLYPQAEVSNGIPPNPQGCWDFWGYSSDDQKNPTFYTKQAPQMQAIMAMVHRLGEALKP